MSVVYIIAGVMMVVFGVMFLTSAGNTSFQVGKGHIELGEGTKRVIGAALILIGGAVLFQQIIGPAVGRDEDSNLFDWINSIIDEITSENSNLPSLGD